MRTAGKALQEQCAANDSLTADITSTGGACDSRPATCELDSLPARRRELLALFSLAVLRHVATDPKSNPGMETRSIDCPSTRSIVRTMAISSGAMNVKASPVCAARPVRPMRWT